MKLDLNYYAAHDLKKVICATQRVASASIAETLRPAHADSKASRISVAQVKSFRKKDWPVLLWIRDPLDRLACAFHVFGEKFNGSFRRFIDHAISTQNPHWSPQIELHTHNYLFLPTVVLSFNDFARTWAKHVPGYPLEHIGANPNRWKWIELAETIDTPYHAKIKKHWENDFVLHELALKLGEVRDQIEVAA